MRAKKKQAAVGKMDEGRKMWTSQGSAKQMRKSAYERRKMRCQRVKSAREPLEPVVFPVSMRRSVEF